MNKLVKSINNLPLKKRMPLLIILAPLGGVILVSIAVIFVILLFYSVLVLFPFEMVGIQMPDLLEKYLDVLFECGIDVD